MEDGPPPDAESDTPELRILRSEDLLQGAREIWIDHFGEIYRLRLTERGRLYLTK